MFGTMLIVPIVGDHSKSIKELKAVEDGAGPTEADDTILAGLLVGPCQAVGFTAKFKEGCVVTVPAVLDTIKL
ncbi:MAG: hypothetical protein NVS1B7_5010 [Candidatus Saccharimonadales bacterium]